MSVTIEEMNAVVLNGYTQYSGIEITELKDGFAAGKITLEPQHRNPYGAVHGGVIFCLGDVIGGVACRTLGALPVTLSSSISYFRVMLEDRVVYAEAQVVKHGKTTDFVEIRILNESRTECARISANYYNLEGRIS